MYRAADKGDRIENYREAHLLIMIGKVSHGMDGGKKENGRNYGELTCGL